MLSLLYSNTFSVLLSTFLQKNLPCQSNKAISCQDIEIKRTWHATVYLFFMRISVPCCVKACCARVIALFLVFPWREIYNFIFVYRQRMLAKKAWRRALHTHTHIHTHTHTKVLKIWERSYLGCRQMHTGYFWDKRICLSVCVAGTNHLQC